MEVWIVEMGVFVDVEYNNNGLKIIDKMFGFKG